MNNPSPPAAAAVPSPEVKAQSLNLIVFLVSTMLLIGCFTWYACFAHVPISHTEEFIVRVLLGLAGAGFATTLTGFFEITNKVLDIGLRAGGSFAVFVIALSWPVPTDLMMVEKRRSDYIMKETTYVVDLRNRIPRQQGAAPSKISPVDVLRNDKIRKTKLSNKNVELFFGTGSGDSIEWKGVKNAEDATYISLEKRDVDPWRTPLTKNYSYVVPMGERGPGAEKDITSKFTFWDCFSGETSEWFATETKYPTDRLVVTFLFPDSKPCKKMKVKELRIDETRPTNDLQDNQPELLMDGKVVTWSGQDQEGGHKFQFNWDW